MLAKLRIVNTDDQRSAPPQIWNDLPAPPHALATVLTLDVRHRQSSPLVGAQRWERLAPSPTAPKNQHCDPFLSKSLRHSRRNEISRPFLSSLSSPSSSQVSLSPSSLPSAPPRHRRLHILLHALPQPTAPRARLPPNSRPTRDKTRHRSTRSCTPIAILHSLYRATAQQRHHTESERLRAPRSDLLLLPPTAAPVISRALLAVSKPSLCLPCPSVREEAISDACLSSRLQSTCPAAAVCPREHTRDHCSALPIDPPIHEHCQQFTACIY